MTNNHFDPNQPRDKSGKWVDDINNTGLSDSIKNRISQNIDGDDVVKVDPFGMGTIINEDESYYFVKFLNGKMDFDKRVGTFENGKFVVNMSFTKADKNSTIYKVQELLASVGYYSSYDSSRKSESEYLKVGISKFRISAHKSFYHFNGDGNFYKNETPMEIFNAIKRIQRIQPINF